MKGPKVKILTFFGRSIDKIAEQCYTFGVNLRMIRKFTVKQKE